MAKLNQISKKAFSLIELSIAILIIGLLIAGISKGSDIIRKFKLVAAQNISSGSPVTIIPNLTVWYDATSANGLDLANLTNNDLVEEWKDVSPRKASSQKINLTQSIDDNKPQFISNAINGLPALYFDGSDIIRKSDVLGRDIFKSEEVTVFLVQNYKDGASENINWYSGDQRLSLHATYSNNIIYFEHRQMIQQRATYEYPSPQAFNDEFRNKNKILNFIKSPQNMEIRVNGNQMTLVPITSNLDVSKKADLVVGNLLRGLIAEIIIFDRSLNSVEIEKIEKYLSEKWSINL